MQHRNYTYENNIRLKKELDDDLVDNTLYRKIIDSLRYLCNTRSNICLNVGFVSGYMEKPRLCHYLQQREFLDTLEVKETWNTHVTSTKQKKGIIALSSREIEYVAVSYIVCQSLWLEMILK